jgi:hypothetical protein
MSKRNIIGMGCDPNRARFAQQNWAPQLGVNMDFAPNESSLLNQVRSKEYAVVFIAPGMCQVLGPSGRERVFAQVKQIQPNTKCVLLQDATQTLPVLGEALGLEGFSNRKIQMMSNDWPFVD